MNNVEILENLIEGFRKAEFAKLDDIEDLYERFNYKDYKALENILKERQEDKERIKNSISKDKIRKNLEICQKVYEREMKPYQTEYGLNVTGLSKKEKEQLVNKRNCLIAQMETYEMLLEEGDKYETNK